MISKKDFIQMLVKLLQEGKTQVLLSEESMKVTSLKLNFSIPLEDRKEIFNIAEDVLKESVIGVLKIGMPFNPVAYLISPETLYLCEFEKISQDISKKFSLIGKYAKKYNCPAVVFAAVGEVISENKDFQEKALFIISIAYDERLIFEGGRDSKMSVFLIKKEDEEVQILPFENVFKNSENFFDNLRKPIEKITTLGKIIFN